MTGGLGHIPADQAPHSVTKKCQHISPSDCAEATNETALKLQFDGDQGASRIIDPFADIDPAPSDSSPQSGKPKVTGEFRSACTSKSASKRNAKPRQSQLKRYPHATDALDQGIAYDPAYRRPDKKIAWIFEIIERFQLVPAHAKAFGFPSLSSGKIETAYSALVSYRAALILSPTTALDRVRGHERLLHLCWLGRDVLKLPRAVFDVISMSDDEIVSLSNRQSREVRDLHNRLNTKLEETDRLTFDDLHNTWDFLRIHHMQPLNEAHVVESLKSFSPDRRIRILKQKRKECSLWLSQVLELVGDHKGRMSNKFVSVAELSAYTHSQMAQEQWATKHELVDHERGVRVNMFTVTSTKKKAQMSQFYAVAKGIEQIATEAGWDYAMLTLTLPGKWHSARTGKAGGRKSEWNMATPLEAARELQTRWNSVSTRLKQILGKNGLGFSMKEPHADGTAHMHAMICAPKKVLIQVREYMIDYAAREGDEDVSLIPRRVFVNTKKTNSDGGIVYQTILTDFLAWKPQGAELENGRRSSSPASYMFKYLSKGLLNADVSAWKSCVAVRQISWINFGRGFVAKWQACYQSSKAAESFGQEDVAEACEAMTQRDWGKALSIILGLEHAPTDAQRLHRVTDCRVNQFGEQRNVLVGFATVEDGEFFSNRSRHSWTVEKLAGSAATDPMKDPELKAARDLAAERILMEITDQGEAEPQEPRSGAQAAKPLLGNCP
ncbi:replication endonuclease [Neorhizobium galegae]|nr:replication endonuclease [Neorhizobium galegae]